MASRFTRVRKRVRRLRRVALVAGGIYASAVRPWARTWGATDEEAEQGLPGDRFITHPRLETTRAITIHAPAEQIWPWLVQMGQDRGGFYSYDFLENLFGLEVHSAEEVVEELQHLQLGEHVRTSPGDGPVDLQVVDLQPDHFIVFRAGYVPGRRAGGRPEIDADDHIWLDASWSFTLKPVDRDETRLLVRTRMDHRGLPMVAFTNAVVEPVHFLMERKMLKGIRARVEQGAAPSKPPPAPLMDPEQRPTSRPRHQRRWAGRHPPP
ncbi:MAG: hypothetical protein R3185_00205 [Candidatus Thermoplasmatota archaeon]|nr:hypothetical protein [Candidatus Thermoplasmatota archaeon]